jgi:hypothetical protein
VLELEACAAGVRDLNKILDLDIELEAKFHPKTNTQLLGLAFFVKPTETKIKGSLSSRAAQTARDLSFAVRSRLIKSASVTFRIPRRLRDSG